MNIDKLLERLSNPPIITRDYFVEKNNESRKYKEIIRVVRDDLLECGTKQRAIIQTLKNIDNSGFVYAGPANGYSQAAIAFGCYHLGKKCSIFIVSGLTEFRPTTIARNYGANINSIKGSLKDVQDEAILFAENNGYYYLEFGLDIDIFKINLKLALSSVLFDRDSYTGTIWLAVGSGTLLSILLELYPNAKFSAVIVGKEYKTNNSRVKIYKAPEKFYDPAKVIPPYNSEITYDAKVWSIVVSNARGGDMIWNVAG